MPKINLAQETVRNQLLARRRRLLHVVSISVLLLTLGVYGGAFYLVQQMRERVRVMNENVRVLDGELKKRREDVGEIVAFRKRLQSVRWMLEHHVSWIPLLDELERLLIPQATLLSLEGNIKTTELLAAVRVPTIEAGADLIASLQHRQEVNATLFPFVTYKRVTAEESKTADSTSGAKPILGYTIDLSLRVPESAFHKSSSEPTGLPDQQGGVTVPVSEGDAGAAAGTPTPASSSIPPVTTPSV